MENKPNISLHVSGLFTALLNARSSNHKVSGKWLWMPKGIAVLRRSPPAVRVTREQKLCTDTINIVLQTSVRLFWISSHKKKKSFLTTPKFGVVRNDFFFLWEENEFTWNTWKYWWNDSDDESSPVFAQFLLTLKFIFSSSLRKLFLVLFLATIYIFSLKGKCEKDCKIPKIILVQGFCPLKTEITWFPIRFLIACRSNQKVSQLRH